MHTITNLENTAEDAVATEANNLLETSQKEVEPVEEASSLEVAATLPEEDSEKSSKLDCKKAQKRKTSLEPDETQSKMLKIVSIESILNQTSEKEESLLRTSLQAKKIFKKPSSSQSSPATSARSSVHEITSEEIKSEPDAETVAAPVQDLEAKKKYLSALNIQEKGAIDVQKTKSNEIRTRSKTEEKREKNRTGNDAQLQIEKLSKANDNGTVKSNSTVTKKKVVQFPFTGNAKSDASEIYVKSFAKLGSWSKH